MLPVRVFGMEEIAGSVKESVIVTRTRTRIVTGTGPDVVAAFNIIIYKTRTQDTKKTSHLREYALGT